MKKLIYHIIVLCFLSISVHAQWIEDFTEGGLLNWQGDVESFTTNDQNQLQLNDDDAGESFIFRPSEIDFDTVSIGFYMRLDFSPSDNNKTILYLALDGEDPSTSSGYSIEVGENGGDDALRFYYIDNGVKEFIGSATEGKMSQEPSVARVDIDVYPSGLWVIRTNYLGGTLTTLDMEFMDDRFSFKNSQFFGLYCKYSASRSDKFFYDDIFVIPFEKDTKSPEVVSVIPQNDNSLKVEFNEAVELGSATTITNYSVNNNIGNPNTVTSLNSFDTEYLLEFDASFDPTLAYELTVTNIEDVSENAMISQTLGFLFFGQPSAGDLLVSEILFDPFVDGEDFVEIYNTSEKNLSLEGLIIRNSQRDESVVIESPLTIAAESFMAFSENVEQLQEVYDPIATANIIFQEIPGFNNRDGNVSLLYGNETLDSFDYSEDQHFSLINDTEGVSLERVSYDIDANETDNWASASEVVNFASPGYENSNRIKGELPDDENFVFENEVFSPNQDGEDDRMILNYSLEKSGYVANIDIYNPAGFLVKRLKRNSLLAADGIIVWDGTNEEGIIANIGMYIVVGELFHPDGDVKNFKLVTVLADYF